MSPARSAGRGDPFDMDGFLGAVRSATPGEWTPAKSIFGTAFLDADRMQPSPRASLHAKSGEWDEASEFALFRIQTDDLDSLCRAEFGQRGMFCVARSLGSGGTCAVGSHKQQAAVQPGWHVSGSASAPPTSPAAQVGRRGVFLDPHLPFGSRLDDPVIASKLLDPEAPLRLPIGRWKYLFDLLGRPEAPSLPAPSPASTDAVIVEAASSPLDPDIQVMLDQAEQAAAQAHISATDPPLQEEGGGVDEFKDEFEDEGAPHPPAANDQDLLLSRIEDLEAAVGSLRISGAEMEEILGEAVEAIRTRDERITALETNTGQLKALSQRVLRMATAALNRGPATGGGAPEPTPPEVTEGAFRTLRNAVGNLQEQVRIHHRHLSEPKGALGLLRTTIRDLEEKSTHGGVEFGGKYRWSSPREFKDWFVRCAGTAEAVSFGLFIDSFVLLHGLDPGTVSMKDALDREHAVRKVKFQSLLEARCATSHMTNYPDVFGTSGDRDEFMKTIDTCAKWEDPGTLTGLSLVIANALTSDVKAIEEGLSHEIEDPQLQMLATMMLNKSQVWVTNFMSFGEKFHGEMAAAPSMTPKEAWTLTRNMMGEVLRHARKARNSVATTRESDRLMHVWGCLKAHMAMEEFRIHQFRDHPALAGIQTRFLVKRKTDIDGLSRLTTRMTSAENKLGIVSQEVKNLRKN